MCVVLTEGESKRMYSKCTTLITIIACGVTFSIKIPQYYSSSITTYQRYHYQYCCTSSSSSSRWGVKPQRAHQIQSTPGSRVPIIIYFYYDLT